MKFTFVSNSAASEIVGPDKHVNIGQVVKLNARLEKAAKAFQAKVTKQDAATLAILTKAGAKTEKQIAKALAPVGYFYIQGNAKPVAYSAARDKAKNTAYLRARSLPVYQRVRPTANPKHKLICAIYNKFVVGAELFKEQQALLSAVTKHKAQKEKTTTVIKQVNADNRAAATASFNEAATKLKAALSLGKVKDAQITEIQSVTGLPSIYLKFGAQVLVVRPATVAQLNKAKKTAEAKTEE
jgi:hypothetical protein